LHFITSVAVVDPLPSDVKVTPENLDFVTTGLRVPSTIRVHRLLTIPISGILRELGVLSPALQARVEDALRCTFRL
jgi:mRNA interferase MazF